jgi:hypothetical protein
VLGGVVEDEALGRVEALHRTGALVVQRSSRVDPPNPEDHRRIKPATRGRL